MPDDVQILVACDNIKITWPNGYYLFLIKHKTTKLRIPSGTNLSNLHSVAIQYS